MISQETENLQVGVQENRVIKQNLIKTLTSPKTLKKRFHIFSTVEVYKVPYCIHVYGETL